MQLHTMATIVMPLVSILALLAVFSEVLTYPSAAHAPAWPESTEAAAVSGPLNLLTILGDSYSDLGNTRQAEISLYKLSGEAILDPKYFPNRAPTNGLTWGGFLSKASPGLNVRGYAVGGATMCHDHSYRFTMPQVPLPPMPSVKDQVSLYLQDARSRVLSRQRAVAIWAGTNDVYSGLVNDPDGEGPQPPLLLLDKDRYLGNVSHCLEDIIRTLVAAGERRVVVLNVVPKEDLPSWASNPEMMTSTVPVLNEKLKQSVAKLQEEHPDASITLIDINTALKALTSTPGAAATLGIVDVTTPCITPANPLDMTANPYVLAGPACSDANAHLFCDPAHYSQVVHEKVISKAVAEHLGLKEEEVGCGGKGGGDGETCTWAA